MFRNFNKKLGFKVHKTKVFTKKFRFNILLIDANNNFKKFYLSVKNINY